MTLAGITTSLAKVRCRPAGAERFDPWIGLGIIFLIAEPPLRMVPAHQRQADRGDDPGWPGPPAGGRAGAARFFR
jgi:hypothetical protein